MAECVLLGVMKKVFPVFFLLALSGAVRAQVSPEDAFLLAPNPGDVTLEGTIERTGEEGAILRVGAQKWFLRVNDNSVLRTPSGAWRERAALRTGQKVRVVGLPLRAPTKGLSTLQARVLFVPESAPVTPVSTVTSDGLLNESGLGYIGVRSNNEPMAGPPLATLQSGALKLDITHAGFYPLATRPGQKPVNAARQFMVAYRWQTVRPYRVREDGWRDNIASALSLPEGAIKPILTFTPQTSFFWRTSDSGAPQDAPSQIRSVLKFAPVALEPNTPVTTGQTLATRTGTQLTLASVLYTPSEQGSNLKLEWTQDKEIQIHTSLVVRAFDENGELLSLRPANSNSGGKGRTQNFRFSEPVKASKITLHVLLSEFDPARVNAGAIKTLRYDVSPSALWKADPRPELKRALPESGGTTGDYALETLLARQSGDKVDGAIEGNLNPVNPRQWSPRLWLWPHDAKAQNDSHLTFTAQAVRAFADDVAVPVRLDELFNAPHDFRADGTLALPGAFDDLMTLHLAKPLAETAKLRFEVDAVATQRQNSSGHLIVPVPALGQTASLSSVRVQGDEDGFFRPLSVAHFASKDAFKAMPDWAKARLDDGEVVAVVLGFDSITDAKPKFEPPYAVGKDGAPLLQNLAWSEGNALTGDKSGAITLFLRPPATGQSAEIWVQAQELQAVGAPQTLVFPVIERAAP